MPACWWRRLRLGLWRRLWSRWPAGRGPMRGRWLVALPWLRLRLWLWLRLWSRWPVGRGRMRGRWLVALPWLRLRLWLLLRLCSRWPVGRGRMRGRWLVALRCRRWAIFGCGHRPSWRTGGRRRRRRIRRTTSVHRAARRRVTVLLRRRRPVGVRWLRIIGWHIGRRARLIGRWSRRRRIRRTASVHRVRLVGRRSRRWRIRRTARVGNRRRPRLHSGCRHLSWWRLLDLGVRCRNVCRTQALYFACSQRLARVLCQLLLLLGKWHGRSRRFCLCHHGTVGNCCWWL